MFKWWSPLWLIQNYFILWGGGKDGGDAPDFGPLAAATEKAAELGAELGNRQLDENIRQYNQNFGVARPIIQAQGDLASQSVEQGDDYFNYMKQFSRPVETNLFYETMGFTPDEIAQIEASRRTETDAFTASQREQAQRTTPISFDVPTYTQQQNLPEGAIKGSDIQGVIRLAQPGLDPRYVPHFGMAAASILANTGVTADPDKYYVRGADGRYSVVNPTQSLVEGKKSISIDVPSGARSGGGVVQTPDTDALTQRLAAQATERQKLAEGAERDMFMGLNTDLANRIGATNTQVYNRYRNDIETEAAMAKADARAGLTNALNTAARQGLRYGFSPDRLASVARSQGLSSAAMQAAAANQTRTNATNTMYGRSVGQGQQTLTGAQQNRSMRQQDENLRYAKKLDVAGLYRNLPGASQGAYQTAINAGNSAVNNQLGVSGQFLQGMNAGTNTIMAGQQQRINGLSNIAQMQTGIFNAQQNQPGFGSVLGTAAGMLGSYGLSKLGG